MFTLQLPAFGETEYTDIQENKMSRVVLISNVAADGFEAYCALLEQEGFVQAERRDLAHRSFAAYGKDGWGVFVNYFAGTSELQLVVEENSAYFSFTNHCGPLCTTPQVTQVKLLDYGLSYVVRLSDGRLIIIDGGNTPDWESENLFARLKKDSPTDRPVIAAWIMTHPHSDHINCFFPFMARFGEQVTLEKLFFNFPDAHDLEHYPALDKLNGKFSKWAGEDTKDSDVIGSFLDLVEKTGARVYTPHTGQRYELSDAKVLFYATMDDTIHCSGNINATSLMFTMELGGQKIFFAADGSFSDARLAERYGAELKVDILQVPHHGFGCGTAQGQIDGFRLMEPRICLLPVEKSLAYTSFTTYREGTAYLMSRMNVEEMITGEEERTLALPYTPVPDGAMELHKRFTEGRDNSGARTWIFNDLNTARKEDFIFSVLNTTYINANIRVELYFENMQKKIIHVNNKGLRLGVFRLNCLLTPEEDQSVFDAPDFLESRDIPENTYFSVRFMSDLPVVISHRDHAPAYRSSIV